MANILLLDNIDSFSYNLVEHLRQHHHHTIVYRNTVNLDIIIHALKRLKKPILILSPGPGVPQRAGCMLKLIQSVRGHIPIIGICLGHQAITEAYGGTINYADEIFHGRSSLIDHDGLEMFEDMPHPCLLLDIILLYVTLHPMTLL